MIKYVTGIILALFMSQALAATTPNSFIAPQVVGTAAVAFIQGTDPAGTYKTIYTGGANGSKCFSLQMNFNDQGATHVITLRLTLGGVANDMATYTTTIGLPGNTLGQNVNLFSQNVWPGLPADTAGNPYIYLKSGDTLSATFSTALSTGNRINFVVMCGDF